MPLGAHVVLIRSRSFLNWRGRASGSASVPRSTMGMPTFRVGRRGQAWTKILIITYLCILPKKRIRDLIINTDQKCKNCPEAGSKYPVFSLNVRWSASVPGSTISMTASDVAVDPKYTLMNILSHISSSGEITTGRQLKKHFHSKHVLFDFEFKQ